MKEVIVYRWTDLSVAKEDRIYEKDYREGLQGVIHYKGYFRFYSQIAKECGHSHHSAAGELPIAYIQDRKGQMQQVPISNFHFVGSEMQL